MSVLSFEDEAEVIARANDTPFGLAAGLMTREPFPRAPRRRGAGGRHRLDQQLQSDAGGDAVRRLQAIGHRPRERAGGARFLHRAQERLRQSRARRGALLSAHDRPTRRETTDESAGRSNLAEAPDQLERLRRNGLGLGAGFPAPLRRGAAHPRRRLLRRRLGVARSCAGILHRTRHVDHTVVPVIGTAIRYAILILVLVAALGQLGVQTTSLLAVLGAAGLAIGLALQGTLSEYRRRADAPLSPAVPRRRLHRDADRLRHRQERRALRHRARHVRRALRLRPELGDLEQAAAQPQPQCAAADVDPDRHQLRRRCGGGAPHLAGDGGRRTSASCGTRPLSSMSTNTATIPSTCIFRAWAPTSIFWDVQRDMIEEAKRRLEAAGIEIPVPAAHRPYGAARAAAGEQVRAPRRAGKQRRIASPSGERRKAASARVRRRAAGIGQLEIATASDPRSASRA